jgi:hypothetical protein
MYTFMLLIIINQPYLDPIWMEAKWQVKSDKDCFKIASQYFNKTVPHMGGTATFNGYCIKYEER